MAYFQNKFRIESNRLRDWDYSIPWWYYVTINTKNHVDFFGKVVAGKMELNGLRNVTEKFWLKMPDHFPSIELDYHIIMPNHIHGIIILNPGELNCGKSNVETGYIPSLQRQKQASLGVIVGTFKAAITRWCNQNSISNFNWQPRFYDRIIRNEKELHQIRKYIEQNPLKWDIEKNDYENLIID
ncbi:MAG: hypothetical protein NTX65_15355 [Ignavibacteriales bacterium]|nr:hypothetical protein [Ignavibacteriales bacterium]